MRTKIAEHSKETWVSCVTSIPPSQVLCRSRIPPWAQKPASQHHLTPPDPSLPFGFGLLRFQSGSPSSNRHLEKQELQGKSASLSHTNPFKSFQAHPRPVLMSCCVTPRGYNTLQRGRISAAQEMPLGAGRDKELLSLWATARLQRLQFHFAL